MTQKMFPSKTGFSIIKESLDCDRSVEHRKRLCIQKPSKNHNSLSYLSELRAPEKKNTFIPQ